MARRSRRVRDRRGVGLSSRAAGESSVMRFEVMARIRSILAGLVGFGILGWLCFGLLGGIVGAAAGAVVGYRARLERS